MRPWGSAERSPEGAFDTSTTLGQMKPPAFGFPGLAWTLVYGTVFRSGRLWAAPAIWTDWGRGSGGDGPCLWCRPSSPGLWTASRPGSAAPPWATDLDCRWWSRAPSARWGTGPRRGQRWRSGPSSPKGQPLDWKGRSPGKGRGHSSWRGLWVRAGRPGEGCLGCWWPSWPPVCLSGRLIWSSTGRCGAG